MEAKFFWDFHIVGDWLLALAGTGMGVMYYDLERSEYPGTMPFNHVRPFGVFDANWIVRLWEGRVDLKFSPLVWGPSHFRIAPVGSGRPTTSALFHYDMAHFAVAVRF